MRAAHRRAVATSHRPPVAVRTRCARHDGSAPGNGLPAAGGSLPAARRPARTRARLPRTSARHRAAPCPRAADRRRESRSPRTAIPGSSPPPVRHACARGSPARVRPEARRAARSSGSVRTARRCKAPRRRPGRSLGRPLRDESRIVGVTGVVHGREKRTGRSHVHELLALAGRVVECDDKSAHRLQRREKRRQLCRLRSAQHGWIKRTERVGIVERRARTEHPPFARPAMRHAWTYGHAFVVERWDVHRARAGRAGDRGENRARSLAERHIGRAGRANDPQAEPLRAAAWYWRDCPTRTCTP